MSDQHFSRYPLLAPQNEIGRKSGIALAFCARSGIVEAMKSAKTWHDSFAVPLRHFMAKTPEAEAPCVVYDGESLVFSDGLRARNFHDFARDPLDQSPQP